MDESIGKYLQRKRKEKGMENEDIATFLNISASTVDKIFPLDDIYVSRLIKLCILFDEDLVDDYYYQQEPLKGFKAKRQEKLQQEIENYKNTISLQERIIREQADHLATQQKLIGSLEKEVKGLKGE